MLNEWCVPDEARLEKGAVAVVECPEEIACNPCVTVCKSGAITMGSINERPRIEFDKCTGCGRCVQICPGLAIFLVRYLGEKAQVSIPYEYLPFPELRQIVDVLNRSGDKICNGQVLRVIPREKSLGDTPVVTIEIPRQYAMDARDIFVKEVDA